MGTDRIRIALVITELEVGGAERCLVNLARGMDRHEFEVVVYSLASRPAAAQDQLAQLLDTEAITVRYLDVNRPWQALAAVQRLRRAFRDQRPQVVQSFLFHANVISGWALPPKGTAALSMGIRVADPARWRMQLEHRIARRAARIVCVSHATAVHFLNRDDSLSDRITVIPNGIDVADFARRTPADLTRLGLAAQQRAITCVARLARQKGIDQLLTMAPDILGPLPDHVLLLVGDGPDSRELRHMAARCPMADRIRFVGWRADVPEILLASDLLVLPSRWEGMPNVLLEAMACGRPVVSTAAEGVGQLLGPLSRLQMATDNRPQSLIEKIVTIVSQPQLQRQLGQQNRHRVATEFSLQGMIQAYQQLFRQLARPD